ncbi:glycosyltransferase family 39 protein [Zobellia russellii]|uniref:glycosyltransferase family 39 protein n=1 Tax=Zobellia russellii TaxID=248907 RepID=UPI001BFFB32E|nr:glycosyltransferase family 39 protein [Zobellia russellii]MBT9187259.1 glycosyltransferase family 39 protein [Zobellia russellii]
MKFFDAGFLHPTNTKNLYLLSFLIIVLYTISLFYNLHLAPLYTEEPRRALVALEMLLNNNFVVTTILNQTFYDHPPLWNIVLAGSIKLFGYNTFALRFPSAFSFFLTGILSFYMGKKYVNTKFGILAAFYYLVCADIYFYFSVTAEIDIFYSLLVVLSIFSIFHFYQQRRFFLMFGCAYFFITLAFLTKGFASFAFIIITLGIYLLYKKDLKRLFSWPHIFSFLLSAAAVYAYFYIYGSYEDLGRYVSEMWGLTQQRTLLSDKFDGMIKHLFFLPLNFLAVIFPATLFLLFIWKKEQIRNIKANPYLLFLTLIFLGNFLVYWVSPGARMRYTYMFFPMVITVLTYPLFLQLNETNWKHKTYHIFFKVLMIATCIACLAIPFIGYFSIIPHLKYTVPIFGLVVAAIFLFHHKTIGYTKHLFVIAFIVMCRLVFDHVALPLKALTSSSAPHQTYAKDIHKIIGDEAPLYVFTQEDLRTHIQTPFKLYATAAYLEMSRKVIVTKTDQCELPGYYIFNQQNLEDRTPLYKFTISEVDMALVRID